MFCSTFYILLPKSLVFVACQSQFAIQNIFTVSMSASNQYVISLVKLILPSKVNAPRVTLSVKLLNEENFIQQSRDTRNNKINLYRECIFLPSLPKAMSFKIYQIKENDQKILLKEIKVSQKQLSSFSKQNKTFNTSDSGYQITWEASIFSEESNDLQEMSDRDYSILNIPFENDEEPESKLTSNFYQNSTNVTSRNQSYKFDGKKRLKMLHTESEGQQHQQNSSYGKLKKNNATFNRLSPCVKLI